MQCELVKKSVSAEVPFLLDETFTDDMGKLLTALIEEMLDTEIPFSQCEEGGKVCGYCEFCDICRRERKIA